MKLAVLVLATLACVAAGSVIPTQHVDRTADEGFLRRQKDIVKLVIGLPYDDHYFKDFADFDITDKQSWFTKPYVVDEFLSYYKHGFLGKEEVFSMESIPVFEQTYRLFDLFYYAKDFESFYKVAAWARYTFNPEQFFYAFQAAIYHRSDLVGILLPPVYQVFPNYFVPSDVVQKIYRARMQGQTSYVNYVNNSGWEYYWRDGSKYNTLISGPFDTTNENIEERLSYFREDVGLGEFVSQFFSYYLPFYNQTKYENIQYFRRGELFYNFLQQFYARYSLERVANGLPKAEVLGWDRPIKVGYNPRYSTPYGYGFIARPDGITPEEYNPKGVWGLRNLESRIFEALDTKRVYNETTNQWGYFDGQNDEEILGNLILGTPESPSTRYYQTYFYKALSTLGRLVQTASDSEYIGGVFTRSYLAPKDPAFYSFIQRILTFFKNYKNTLPYYTQKDLAFNGVRIESFNVDKLVTYFDTFDYEVNNLFPVPSDKYHTDFHFAVKHYRLNNKPFTYKLTVNSEKNTDAVVRVFVGPKYDKEGREYTLEQARDAFVEFDRFPVKLVAGQNFLERNSKDSTVYEEDHEGLKSLWERTMKSIRDQAPFEYSESYRCGFPSRLLLPKGTRSGQTFVFYAIVSPYVKPQVTPTQERYFEKYAICGGSQYYDGYSYGYPFDRVIKYEDEFQVPNSYFQDVVVYHRRESDINRAVPTGY